eukprot:scaffold2370_cov124-Skeletonema_menzelii.AAC.12
MREYNEARAVNPNMLDEESIDPDDLAARMKQQQLRLFYMSQQTKRSRALLQGMRCGRSKIVSQCGSGLNK